MRRSFCAIAAKSSSGSRTALISPTSARRSASSSPGSGGPVSTPGGRGTEHVSTHARRGSFGRCTLRPAMSDAPLKLPLEIEDIKAILPHRSPFLLVDRILELEPDRRIVGLKNVTSNERYFIAGPGGVPTLPASILTEAMAQAGAVLILSKPENRGRLVYFMGIDKVRYRRPGVAGGPGRPRGGGARVGSKDG